MVFERLGVEGFFFFLIEVGGMGTLTAEGSALFFLSLAAFSYCLFSSTFSGWAGVGIALSFAMLSPLLLH